MGQQGNGNILMKFKPNYKTTEFVTSIIFILICAIGSVLNDSVVLGSQLITVASVAYMVARSLYKRNRMTLIYDGHKTSEVAVFVTAVILNVIFSFFFGLPWRSLIVNYVCLQVVLCVCRGYAKGFGLHNRTSISV